jgi:hypothetical protein
MPISYALQSLFCYLNSVRKGIKNIMTDEKFDKKEFSNAYNLVSFRQKYSDALKDSIVDQSMDNGRVAIRESVQRNFIVT